MPSRIFFAWIVLIGIQSAVAAERSLVVARRSTGGAIVTTPPAPARPVVVASREVPVGKFEKAAETADLLKQKERELERLQAEIKQLKAGMGTNSQILIRVEILEVSLSKLRKMGADFAGPNDQSYSLDDFQGLQKAFKASASDPHDSSAKPGAKSSNSFIALLEENRIAKPLCRPNIVVMSGRPGSFHVGGEIPIPSRDDPKSPIGYQKFGTELDLLAIATDKEHVRMELRVKVSEIDEAHSVEVNGSRIPALISRQCDTAVETKFGEPVILSGGVENRVETVKASDGRMVDGTNEIALIVVATPELVDPITPREAEPSKTSRK